MFGLSYAPPKTARVLELGCASGVNLLGMAHFMPDAKFVGVDLSIVQVHEAQRRAKAIGADNVTYHHMGIDEISQDAGEFDYIIAHGVYSWVSSDIQKAILGVCRDHLSQEGIAFVSYNVLPGWRMKQAARDVFMALTPPNIPAAQRWEYGINWIKEMLENSKGEEKKPLLHQTIAHELENILVKKDLRYLAHEYLEVHNEPLLFREFLSQMSEAELAYLGDAEPGSMVRHLSHPSLQEFFKKHPPAGLVEAEQAIDIMTGRTFRQSLMVKGSRKAQMNRALTPEFFKNLHIQSRMAKTTDKEGKVKYLHQRHGPLNAQPPYGTAALDLLIEHAGMSAPYKTLFEKFAEATNGTEPIFAEMLFSLLGISGIEIYADPYLPKLPKGTTPLALLDIESGRNVTTNAIGEAVGLDPLQALILPLLKGDWDREEAVTKLASMHSKGQFSVNPAPADDAQMRQLLGSMLDKAAVSLQEFGVVG
jgi:SAM-dependent methyltransferase